MNQNSVQIGIFSQCKEERDFPVKENIQTHFVHKTREIGFDETLIKDIGENIFLTFDVDFLGPSIMPSTGTPEPGGFYWEETIIFLSKLIEMKNLLGMDIIELSPVKN